MWPDLLESAIPAESDHPRLLTPSPKVLFTPSFTILLAGCSLLPCLEGDSSLGLKNKTIAPNPKGAVDTLARGILST